MISTEQELLKELDALQNMFAEYVARSSADRKIITQDILKERCAYYMELAKQEIERIGPEKDPDDTKFQQKAAIIGPFGEEAQNIPIGFNSETKRRMMHALADTCKTFLAQAVIIRVAATFANSDTLSKVMGLNPPNPLDKQKLNYWEERMWKWIEKNYGRPRLALLPPELRHDCIVVGGMGPKLQDCGVVIEYKWVNGKFVVTEFPEHYAMRVTMMPRWWQ